MKVEKVGAYPSWQYYPSSAAPPHWILEFVAVISGAKASIDSRVVEGLTSDKVLSELAPGLRNLRFDVEMGKRASQKIRRPVLFGEYGHERVAYEVDAVHDDLGVVVEVEAGRGARGNAAYRDLIRASLIVGAKYLALGVMLEYRHQAGNKTMHVKSYQEVKDQLDAVYASGRLRLPFEGLLLFGC